MSTQKKEKPIIMNIEMVKAILDSRKTQTRRVMKPQPTPDPDRIETYGELLWGWVPTSRSGKVGIFTPPTYKCPYGKIGDRLWVRETWQQFFPEDWEEWPAMLDYYHKKCAWNDECKIFYKANGPEEHPEHGKVNWKPSIHISRIHSRITLEITDIRVERVQNISEEEIIFEGIDVPRCPQCGYSKWDVDFHLDHRLCSEINPGSGKKLFKQLWNSINAKKGYGWESNPWVWVIEFKEVAGG